MKHSLLLMFLILISCSKEELPSSEIFKKNTGPSSDNCEVINPYFLSAESGINSIKLFYIKERLGNSQVVCQPDALDIYLSEDNVEFELIARLLTGESPYLIDGLETDKEYFIKAVHIHSSLKHFESNLVSIKTGFISLPCAEEGCDYLNPFAFGVEGIEGAINLFYGQNSIIDVPGKVCNPDAIDFYISEDNITFEKVVRVNPYTSPHTIGDLQNGRTYFIKMVNAHCDLNPIQLGPFAVTAGVIPLPTFIQNTLPPSVSIEDFRLSKDGNHMVVRNYANDWRHTSLNSNSNYNIAVDAFHGEWSTQDDNEVAFVLQHIIDNAWKSKSLIRINTENNNQEILHEVDDTEDYWIHEFHYSLDGESIYFQSNKDIGDVGYDNRIYENIFHLDLETKELKQITDFYPEEFEMRDFIEDPQRPGNFYILGARYGDKSPGFGGFLVVEDRIDIYYYDAATQTRTPVLMTDYKEEHLSIDGTGENLVFVSNQTGFKELWAYNLSTKEYKQLSNRTDTSPSYRWHHINWISDSEFMVFVEHLNVDKFAVYSL